MRSTDQVIDEDDFFQDTRMSFGDHIEVLRTHLWRAIYGLLFCMVVGFILDGIGNVLERPYIGIGKPLLDIIQYPVRTSLREYYRKRMERLEDKAKTGGTIEEQLTSMKSMKLQFNRAALGKLRGVPIEQVPEENGIVVDGDEVMYNPLDQYKAQKEIDNFVYPRELTALSAQEGFVIYFKVSLIAGLVIASPWVFWQIWSFVAAGLYPHEKRYVHVYLPVSVALFAGGVIMCQFIVMPRTVEALLWFNDFLGVTPDLRLSEWLHLAIMLPLIFGISFQTPLIMLFLERIGLMTVESYKKRWKAALFSFAVISAIFTPTPDAVTMLLLLVPLCLLYGLGIALCILSPGRRNELDDLDVPDSEELIEV